MHAVAFDFGSDRDGDVRAAMSYLERSGAEKIVLIGSSLGGANVLDVASHEPVAAVVTFSVSDSGTWSIDEPGLYIASEGDGDTADAARAWAERFGGKALVVDGSTHGADLLKPHPEVIDEVVVFITSATRRTECRDRRAWKQLPTRPRETRVVPLHLGRSGTRLRRV